MGRYFFRGVRVAFSAYVHELDFIHPTICVALGGCDTLLPFVPFPIRPWNAARCVTTPHGVKAAAAKRREPCSGWRVFSRRSPQGSGFSLFLDDAVLVCVHSAPKSPRFGYCCCCCCYTCSVVCVFATFSSASTGPLICFSHLSPIFCPLQQQLKHPPPFPPPPQSHPTHAITRTIPSYRMSSTGAWPASRQR